MGIQGRHTPGRMPASSEQTLLGLMSKTFLLIRSDCCYTQTMGCNCWISRNQAANCSGKVCMEPRCQISLTPPKIIPKFLLQQSQKTPHPPTSSMLFPLHPSNITTMSQGEAHPLMSFELLRNKQYLRAQACKHKSQHPKKQQEERREATPARCIWV